MISYQPSDPNSTPTGAALRELVFGIGLGRAKLH
ncbi:predicted protein [Plenodomus lingam JN3]|uniref:Uncharacterized protein n=1 Tax=Leptosphaeria maculans (strain JN3 / isolate v23.1.3 / race Av1-4-5-6-7-8) TaxID=985895 RepID=E5A6G3_LEPMJ|nr:predicted protein [Plenodomus lingam JN3]CBX99208.1 predicted protein [Plenodomus lingam JN3]